MRDLIREKLLLDGKLVSKRCTEKFLTKVGLFDFVRNFGDYEYPEVHSLTDIIVGILHGIEAAPRCKCGDFVKRNTDFNANGVWRTFCSQKCAGTYGDFTERYQKVDKAKANLKRKATMLEKYGVETNSQREEVKQSLRDKMKEQLPYEVRVLLEDREWLHNQYVTLQKPSTAIADNLGIFYGTVLEYCRMHGFEIRSRINTSEGERQLAEFVGGICDDVRTHDKTYGFEIDIHCISARLAIEYNGLYWHSSNTRDSKYYHLNKTEKLWSQGIKLLHVYSDEWEDVAKQDIWKSIITHNLGKTPYKVHARKCKVVLLTSKQARLFMEENHLHGFVGGKHIGLLYEGSIVMILTYGRSRFEAVNEILRVCTKKYHSVVGGLNKLLARLPVGKYVTYGDRSFTSSSGYSSAFRLVDKTEPNYFWVVPGSMSRLSRYKAQKQHLSKLLGERYDPSKSEFENMISNGYRILYNSGNYKFELEI